MVTGSRTFGDEEYKIESQTSLLVPPRTIHAFGLRRGRVLKSVSILPDADAVLEHRLLEKGESFEMPEPKKNDVYHRSSFKTFKGILNSFRLVTE